jgi:hypothetical protein
MKLVFLIQQPTEEGEPLFWSNLDGWVSKDCADRFSGEEQLTTPLPAGGIWDYTTVWSTIDFPQS